jgi:peptide/nickel transport system permease protein
MIGLVVFLLLVVSVIVIPLTSPFGFAQDNAEMHIFPAGSVDTITGYVHILGTNSRGQDNFVRLFYGGRTSLATVAIATVFIVVVGSVMGALAGLYGGWVDTVIMRFTDFMLALPLIPMYLFSLRIARPSSQDVVSTVGSVALVFVLFGWMGLARLVRGSILSLRTQPFVEASQALGAGNRRIIFRHLLPNTIAPILVTATFAGADFIIWEAILAYFAQGITEPPVPSWGNMVAGSQGFVWAMDDLNPFTQIGAYILLLPIACILITVLSINYIGEGLRDALDPHHIR